MILLLLLDLCWLSICTENALVITWLQGHGGCPDLETLTLDDSVLEEESALEPVLRGCQHLRVLSLQKHTVRTEIIPRMLERWCSGDGSALRLVDLGYCLDHISKGVVNRLRKKVATNQCMVKAASIVQGSREERMYRLRQIIIEAVFATILK